MFKAILNLWWGIYFYFTLNNIGSSFAYDIDSTNVDFNNDLLAVLNQLQLELFTLKIESCCFEDVQYRDNLEQLINRYLEFTANLDKNSKNRYIYQAIKDCCAAKRKSCAALSQDNVQYLGWFGWCVRLVRFAQQMKSKFLQLSYSAQCVQLITHVSFQKDDLFNEHSCYLSALKQNIRTEFAKTKTIYNNIYDKITLNDETKQDSSIEGLLQRTKQMFLDFYFLPSCVDFEKKEQIVNPGLKDLKALSEELLGIIKEIDIFNIRFNNYYNDGESKLNERSKKYKHHGIFNQNEILKNLATELAQLEHGNNLNEYKVVLTKEEYKNSKLLLTAPTSYYDDIFTKKYNLAVGLVVQQINTIIESISSINDKNQQSRWLNLQIWWSKFKVNMQIRALTQQLHKLLNEHLPVLSEQVIIYNYFTLLEQNIRFTKDTISNKYNYITEQINPWAEFAQKLLTDHKDCKPGFCKVYLKEQMLAQTSKNYFKYADNLIESFIKNNPKLLQADECCKQYFSGSSV